MFFIFRVGDEGLLLPFLPPASAHGTSATNITIYHKKKVWVLSFTSTVQMCGTNSSTYITLLKHRT